MDSLQNPLNANYPQDVTQKPGENAVFIVYALKDLPDTIDKVKDVCANFSALIYCSTSAVSRWDCALSSPPL